MPSLNSFKLFYQFLISSKNTTAQSIAKTYLSFLRDPSKLSQEDRTSFEECLNTFRKTNFFVPKDPGQVLQASDCDLVFKAIFTDYKLFEVALKGAKEDKINFLCELEEECKMSLPLPMPNMRAGFLPKSINTQISILTKEQEVVDFAHKSYDLVYKCWMRRDGNLIKSSMGLLIHSIQQLNQNKIYSKMDSGIDLADFYFLLANCNSYLNNDNNAINFYEKAIEYLNKYFDKQILLNSLQIESLNQTVLELKRHFLFHNNLGVTYSNLAQFEKAYFEFSQCESIIKDGLDILKKLLDENLFNSSQDVQSWQKQLFQCLMCKLKAALSQIQELRRFKRYDELLTWLTKVNPVLDEIDRLNGGPSFSTVDQRIEIASLTFKISQKIRGQNKKLIADMIKIAIDAHTIALSFEKLVSHDDWNDVNEQLDILRNLEFSLSTPSFLQNFSQFSEKNLSQITTQPSSSALAQEEPKPTP